MVDIAVTKGEIRQSLPVQPLDAQSKKQQMLLQGALELHRKVLHEISKIAPSHPPAICRLFFTSFSVSGNQRLPGAARNLPRSLSPALASSSLSGFLKGGGCPLGPRDICGLRRRAL